MYFADVSGKGSKAEMLCSSPLSTKVEIQFGVPFWKKLNLVFTKIFSHGYQNQVAKPKIQSSESYIHTVLNNSVTKALQRLLPAFSHTLYRTSKW